MSARDEPRPVRNLAAWGYQSGSNGDRVEVDVWSVNRRELPENRRVPEPGELEGVPPAPVEAVLRRAGNVVEVRYRGPVPDGYRYIDTAKANGNPDPADATQQAFAGARRALGGDRTGGGTFGEGYVPADEPDLAEVIGHGEDEVIPVVKRDAKGPLSQRIGREPHRDENEEPVEVEPFDGFRNVIRYFTRGSVQRYYVENDRMKRGAPPWGEV